MQVSSPWRLRATQTTNCPAREALAFGALLAGLLALPLQAQVVRGTVTEAVSGVPVAGVVVTLVPATDSPGVPSGMQRAVLSDTRGEFAIAAEGAGRFRLTAKRIGVRQFVSAPFDLGTGETRRVDVAVDRTTTFVLPVVHVSAATPCDTRGRDAARIAALFSEVQTALTATDISLRDSLFAGSVTLYSRSLEPRTRLVMREERVTQAGVTGQPFHAADADSLSRASTSPTENARSGNPGTGLPVDEDARGIAQDRLQVFDQRGAGAPEVDGQIAVGVRPEFRARDQEGGCMPPRLTRRSDSSRRPSRCFPALEIVASVSSAVNSYHRSSPR